MRLTIAVAAWVALASTARADLIRYPQCDPGWAPVRAGHGAHCEPIACPARACPAGSECREVARCWLRRPISSGRVRPDPSRPPPTTRVPMRETCDDGTCDVGTCARARECVAASPAETGSEPETAPEPASEPVAEIEVRETETPAATSAPPSAPASSCACSTGSRGRPAALPAGLLLVLSVGRRRRRGGPR